MFDSLDEQMKQDDKRMVSTRENDALGDRSDRIGGAFRWSDRRNPFYELRTP